MLQTPLLPRHFRRLVIALSAVLSIEAQLARAQHPYHDGVSSADRDRSANFFAKLFAPRSTRGEKPKVCSTDSLNKRARRLTDRQDFASVNNDRGATSRITVYHPETSKMEGGHCDRFGYPLVTLDEFFAGRLDPRRLALAQQLVKRGRSYVPRCSRARSVSKHWVPTYVSVAMDTRFSGQSVRIPSLDREFARELGAKGLRTIPFRVVDTGGAFRHKGTRKIDICVLRGRSNDRRIQSTHMYGKIQPGVSGDRYI